MPLFGRQRRRDQLDSPVNDWNDSRMPNLTNSRASGVGGSDCDISSDQQMAGQKTALTFRCQLAHGSPTGLISGFTNVKELYEKIADCYDIDADQIIFCTLNTHKTDMSKLLGGQIGLEDFIFAHKKGQAREIEIVKTEEALGLTITDNGAGCAFIKRIRPDSIISKIPHIQVGDHIERIDDASQVGCRHFEVAKRLKNIGVGTSFVLRTVEPVKAGFANIGPRTDARAGKKASYGSGKATLRLRANGLATVEDKPDDIAEKAANKINGLLEGFLGINDTELAAQIWELGEHKCNTMEFAEAIDGSPLEVFGFSDDFVIELWGAITDARAGRLQGCQL